MNPVQPCPFKETFTDQHLERYCVNGMITDIYPSETQVKDALEILGLDAVALGYAYCGDKSTEWDHLRPIVKNKKPTGYISDIYDLSEPC